MKVRAAFFKPIVTVFWQTARMSVLENVRGVDCSAAAVPEAVKKWAAYAAYIITCNVPHYRDLPRC